jgi:hypothetical protein
MPSMRRVKVFGLLVLLFVVAILFWTASLRQQLAPDTRTVGGFYAKTKNALGKDRPADVDAATDDEQVARKMAESLREAEQIAKDNANA